MSGAEGDAPAAARAEQVIADCIASGGYNDLIALVRELAAPGQRGAVVVTPDISSIEMDGDSYCVAQVREALRMRATRDQAANIKQLAEKFAIAAVAYGLAKHSQHAGAEQLKAEGMLARVALDAAIDALVSEKAE